MDFKIRDEGEDFGTLVVEPGEDDHYEVSGYGTPAIAFALFAHEAATLIALLRPLAAKQEGDEGHARFREKARGIYANGCGGDFSDGDINVDDDAVVSESDEGAYVAAWVWVPQEGVES